MPWQSGAHLLLALCGIPSKLCILLHLLQLCLQPPHLQLQCITLRLQLAAAGSCLGCWRRALWARRCPCCWEVRAAEARQRHSLQASQLDQCSCRLLQQSCIYAAAAAVCLGQRCQSGGQRGRALGGGAACIAWLHYKAGQHTCQSIPFTAVQLQSHTLLRALLLRLPLPCCAARQALLRRRCRQRHCAGACSLQALPPHVRQLVVSRVQGLFEVLNLRLRGPGEDAQAAVAKPMVPGPTLPPCTKLLKLLK